MERLSTLYSSVFHENPETVAAIAGSASNRRYFRISGAGHSCIGVIGTDVKENEAFLAIASHFRSKGIAVPEVLAVSEDRMAYLQVDLGDEILFDRLVKVRKSGEGMEEVEQLLCKAMAALPKIQFKGAEDFDFSVCYPQPSFDLRMVMFDLNYFKYCFLKPSGLEFNEVLLQDDFERFAADLLQDETDTFLYRDFNARNVMVKDGELYFIDFQGGRRGPIYYDIASFVWQARARFPKELQSRMVEAYKDALKEI